MAKLLELAAHLPVHVYSAGDSIIMEESKDGALFILKSGAVEVRKRGVEVNRTASPGALFGEIALLLGRHHSASVIALEPAEVYVAENGMEFLREHPELNLQLARLLAHRLERATEHLVELHERMEVVEEGDGHVSGVLRRLADQL